MHLFKDRIGSTLPLFLCALIGTSLLAVFSWHAIEEPAQRFKHHLSARLRDRRAGTPRRNLWRASPVASRLETPSTQGVSDEGPVVQDGADA